MKKLLIAIVILIFGCFIYIVFFIKPKKEENFIKIDLVKNNKIINNTGRAYIDTIVHVGLNSLDIKNTTLVINNLDNELKNKLSKDMILRAFIIKQPKRYIIWVDDFGKNETITTLSHELIHLKQYHTNKIIIINQNVIWNGKLYENVNDSDYNLRPWEIEAFSNQNDLSKKIKSKLYIQK
jgi:hypothetical protein